MERAPYEVLFVELNFRKNKAAKSRGGVANEEFPVSRSMPSTMIQAPFSATTADKRRDAKSSPGRPATSKKSVSGTYETR